MEQMNQLRSSTKHFLEDHDGEVAVELLNGVPRAVGELGQWQDVVDFGHRLSATWYELNGKSREVVVDVTAKNDREALGPAAVHTLKGSIPSRSDVVVIGGGIAGLVVALKLSTLGCEVTVLEAAPSLGSRTTACNNGMVHSGFDPKPGTYKAKYNVEGNRLWDVMADALGLHVRRAGSIVVALDEAAEARIPEYLARGQANGVRGCEVVSGSDLRAVEPRLSPKISRALSTPTTGYVEPVEVCRAAGRVIRSQGSQIVQNVRVMGIAVDGRRVVGVRTDSGDIQTNLVINAAGVHADVIAEMAGVRSYSIHPRRGTLVYVEDDSASPFLYGAGPVPGAFTKGGGVTVRPNGTLSVGPSAVEQSDREHVAPTPAEAEGMLEQALRIYPSLDVSAVVGTDAQLRASTYGEDFVVGPAPGVTGFYNVAGIQSPGVAAAPAIANQVVEDLLGLGAIKTEVTSFNNMWRKA